MGEKYDKLYGERLNGALDISSSLIRVGVELLKIECAMRVIAELLNEISEANGNWILPNCENKLKNGANND